MDQVLDAYSRKTVSYTHLDVYKRQLQNALLPVPGADAVVDDIAEGYDQPSGDVWMTSQQPFFPAHIAVGNVQQLVHVTE